MQILGIKPYEGFSSLPSEKLAELIVDAMRAPKEVLGTYTRNLAFLVKVLNLLQN